MTSWSDPCESDCLGDGVEVAATVCACVGALASRVASPSGAQSERTRLEAIVRNKNVT